MKKYFVSGLLLAGFTAFALTSHTTAQTSSSTMMDASACQLDFAVNVRQGPDKGLNAKGKLAFAMVSDGSLTGMLTPKKGGPIKMMGQVNGLSVTMAFYVKGKGMIYGSGMFLEPISKGHCGLSAGGTFAGPREGDIGDWGSCFLGSSTQGIDRTGSQACIPNFFFK